MARGRLAAIGVMIGIAILAAVLVASAGAAQAEREPPEVEVEAPPVDGHVVPYEAWRDTVVEVRVGCEEPQTPGTRTEVELSIGEVPKGASASLNRSSLSWTSETGDCPADGFPFRGNVTASIATDGDAPGFVEQTIALEATVTTDDEAPSGEPRRYGPHEATVAFTPGYHHAHAVRASGPLQVDADGVGTVQATVENRANAEVDFAVHVEDVPAGLEVSIEPESFVLDAGEEAEVEVRAERVDANATLDRSVLAVNVTGEPTHPDAGADAGGHEGVAVPVDLDASQEGVVPAQAPSAGLGLVAVGLALAAVGARRQAG